MSASFECDVADNEITMGLAACDTFKVSHLYKLISAVRPPIAYSRIINDSWKNVPERANEIGKTIFFFLVYTSPAEVNGSKLRDLD